MAENLTNQEWRSIAEQASTEQDPAKLTSLVAELCRSLDERQKNASVSAQRITDPGGGPSHAWCAFFER